MKLFLALSITATCLLALGVIFAFRLMSEGTMPSPASAVSIRDEVVGLLDQAQSDAERGALPEGVRRLEPLSIRIMDSGVLLVFHRRFVERRGYFYSANETGPPEDLEPFCKKISENVYVYYDPG